MAQETATNDEDRYNSLAEIQAAISDGLKERKVTSQMYFGNGNGLKTYYSEKLSIDKTELKEILDKVAAEHSLPEDAHPFGENRAFAMLLSGINNSKSARREYDTFDRNDKESAYSKFETRAPSSLINITVDESDKKEATLKVFNALGKGLDEYTAVLKPYSEAIAVGKNELMAIYNEHVLDSGDAPDAAALQDYLDKLPDPFLINKKTLAAVVANAKLLNEMDAEQHPLGEYRSIAAFCKNIQQKGYLHQPNEAPKKLALKEKHDLTSHLIDALDGALKDTKSYEGLEEEYRKEAIDNALTLIGHQRQYPEQEYHGLIDSALKKQNSRNNPPPSTEKLGFKDAKTTLIAAGSMATVGAIVGLTGGKKKQPEEGVEEDQAPKKSSWFTPRNIIAGLLIVGASYLAFQAAKGSDPIGNFTRGLFGGGEKKEIRGK